MFTLVSSGFFAYVPAMMIELADGTFEEVRAAFSAGPVVALLPTGATEAHGPHLPLATDVIIAREAARRAVARVEAGGGRALVLPPLADAVTDSAGGFAGTISLPLETARLLVRDVIAGAARTGFAGVVLCNAHLEPDNLRALSEGLELARAAGCKAAFPDVTRKPHALRLGEEFKSGACHAGRYETSLVLAAGAAIREARAASLPANPSSLSRAIRDGKKTFVEAGGPEAYFGWPADATRAEGDRLYAELADIFASAALELLR
jgi:creatinine amidohydrolase